MSERKRHMRVLAREARRALAPAERAAASADICRRVLDLIDGREVRTVLGYVATAEEADPARLLDVLRARRIRVALPRVEAPLRLALHWSAEGDALVPGAFGILEPAEEAPLADAGEIDLVLVPGVAFDPACNRLGHGGCFYDNLLPLARPDALKVGLAFDVQLVEEIPAEDHDVPLDFVVTPAGVYEAGGETV